MLLSGFVAKAMRSRLQRLSFDTIDTSELLLSLANTPAEITDDSDTVQRQRMMDEVLREVGKCKTEFRAAKLSEKIADTWHYFK